MHNMMRFHKIFLFLVLSIAVVSCKNDPKKEETETTAAKDTSANGIKLAELSEKIAKSPNDASLLHERARMYIEMKNFQEALVDMQKVMSIDSSKASYNLTMADISLAANRTYDAKNYLEKSLSLDPENTEAMMRLAELNLIVRQYSASVALLNKVLEK